jgi:hypothetical protein
MLKENSSVIQELITKVNQIDISNDSGARLFSRVTSNKVRALSTLNFNKEWKQDSQKFKSAIVYNVNSNGFNSYIFSLNSDEWDALYNYMNRLF